jgi:hypothetical protein
LSRHWPRHIPDALDAELRAGGRVKLSRENITE